MSIYATKTGLWSDPTVWNTGVLPVAGDVVRPNNFIVTMDVDATVAEIRNDAGGGAVANGRFIINSGVSIITTTITVCQISVRLITHSGIGTASITGTITNLNTNAQYLAIINESSGTLNLIGNVVFTQNNTTIIESGFIQNSSDGIINITGTVNGNTSGANRVQCVVNVSTGTININGNVNSPVSVGALFFTVVNISTGTITINGNVTTTASTAIDNRSSGTITVNGNVTHNSGSPILNVSGTITIVGNLTNNYSGSAPSLASALSQSGSGTINVVGDVIAGSITNASSWTINNTSNGIVNITGNVTGNSIGGTTAAFNTCINNAANGTVNVTGTVTNGSAQTGNLLTTLQAIRNATTGIVNIIGNCIGTIAGSAAHQSAAVINVAGGVVNVTGNAIGGSTGNAIQNIGTGTINLNGNAIGGTSYAAVENSNSSGNLIVEKIVFGVNGQTATRGYIKFKNISTMAAETVLKTDATTTNLVDINVVPNLQPAISDVRLGVTYSSGSLTGTMNVPPFNAVKAGVPVDNGVGTAALTPQDVWNVLISGITQSGSIGERLKIVSTIETTGTQLASFNV
jgi:hypothetical protein